MKKTIAVLMMLAMLVSMMMLSTSASNGGLFKTFEEAQDGDMLWRVDFNDESVFTPNYIHATVANNMDFTISDNGHAVTVKGAEGGTAHCWGFWGGTIKGLNINNESQYTMTFKAKAHVEGNNNATGIFGFHYLNGQEIVGYSEEEKVVGIYGSWGAQAEGADQATLNIGWRKLGGDYYSKTLASVATDADGYYTVKVEYDLANGSVKAAYLGADGVWVDDPKVGALNQLDDNNDEVICMIYGYWNLSNATYKDIKYFKGVGLTADQLNAEVPTTDNSGTNTPDDGNTSPAPDTSDVSIAVAAVALASAVVVIASKKRR